jgi:hypothetical protein
MKNLNGCCVNFLVDNGGANIIGCESLFNSIKKDSPWLKHPWDITHELTTKFKHCFSPKRANTVFVTCMNVCKQLSDWFHLSPKKYELMKRICMDLGIEIHYQSRNVNKNRMIPTLRSHLEDVCRNLPAYRASLSAYIEESQKNGKSNESLNEALVLKRQISTHSFMSSLCFLLDVVELEAKTTVLTESHSYDVVSTQNTLESIKKSR